MITLCGKIRSREIKLPENSPEWMASQHVINCMSDDKVQKSWKPKDGDWYFCRNESSFLQINSLEKYYIPKPEIHDSSIRDYVVSDGRWPCDIYIPDKNALESISKLALLNNSTFKSSS